MKYKLIVCGGTFDLLHKGHENFLKTTFGLSEKVLIGITSNKYIQKFKSQLEEDFDKRKKEVVQFLKPNNLLDRAEIISIDQPHEPLLTNRFNPDAIAVTPNTYPVALEINKKRKKMSLSELKIEIIEMEKAEDGEEISSTRIRNGQINRNGRLYINPSWGNKTFILPKSLRSELQKPFGNLLDLVPSNLNPEKLVTIGDVTTKKFNDKNVGQILSIVDFKVHRNKEFDQLSDLGFDENIKIHKIRNEHGTINSGLFDLIKTAILSKERQVILIDGEEDLSFLPTMLVVPLGFLVYYGQPNQGLVEVEVTQNGKEKVYDLVSRFEY